MQEKQWAYVIARWAIGLSFFGHGLVRLPKLTQFSTYITEQFQQSILPDALVAPYSYALPIAEFIAGLLIILGLFTRQGLIFGAFITLSLIFGTCLIENWSALPSQLIHIAFLSVLLAYLPYNAWAVDRLINKR